MITKSNLEALETIFFEAEDLRENRIGMQSTLLGEKLRRCFCGSHTKGLLFTAIEGLPGHKKSRNSCFIFEIFRRVFHFDATVQCLIQLQVRFYLRRRDNSALDLKVLAPIISVLQIVSL